MKRFVTRLTGATAVSVVAGGLLVGFTSAAYATGSQPWLQVADTNSVAGLSFFDASNAQISSGSTNTPIAVVQGQKTISNSDNQAVLYGFSVGSGAGEQLSDGPVSFTAGSLPTYHSAAKDLTIADLVSDFQSASGLYELRLLTSAKGTDASTGTGFHPTYDSVDIQVSGSTWSEVPGTATATALSVTPGSPASYGTKVTLTATVTAGSAAVASGSVRFTDGSKTLGTIAVNASGQASYSTSTLSDATHSLKATYVPAASAPVNYVTSSSAAKSFVVKAKATTTGLKASASSIKKGAKLTLTASVSPTSAAGTVTFYDGKAKLKAVRVGKTGKATLAVTSLSVGTHSLKAVFAASNKSAYGASTSKIVKVKVAKK